MNYKRKRKYESSKYLFDVVWGFKKSFKKDYLEHKKFKKLKHKIQLNKITD